MTPQERQRVAELFERLARLENTPREREAEELIAQGLQYVPHAPYALIQTVLVQEEALARANERIAALETELEGDGQPAEGGGGFLGSLRDALSGGQGDARRGSVPSIGSGARPMGVPPGLRSGAAPAANAPDPQIGRGGSFLGQAASIAAGVVVGSMVVDALRGQFGSETTAGQAQAQEADTSAQQANAEPDASGYEDTGYENADVGGDFDFGGDFG